jgi:hypothetical protein
MRTCAGSPWPSWGCWSSGAAPTPARRAGATSICGTTSTTRCCAYSGLNLARGSNEMPMTSTRRGRRSGRRQAPGLQGRRPRQGSHARRRTAGAARRHDRSADRDHRPGARPGGWGGLRGHAARLRRRPALRHGLRGSRRADPEAVPSRRLSRAGAGLPFAHPPHRRLLEVEGSAGRRAHPGHRVAHAGPAGAVPGAGAARGLRSARRARDSPRGSFRAAGRSRSGVTGGPPLAKAIPRKLRAEAS